MAKLPSSANQRFLIQVFNDEALLFDRYSGDTHFLNAIAYARLKSLPDIEIKQEHAAEMDDVEWSRLLESVDKQLRDWGLIG